MNYWHDPSDRPAYREGEGEGEAVDAPTGTPSELRWIQLREPRHALEIGRNGRVLGSHFHERWDAWEVLLETDEGEPSE